MAVDELLLVGEVTDVEIVNVKEAVEFVKVSKVLNIVEFGLVFRAGILLEVVNLSEDAEVVQIQVFEVDEAVKAFF